jgi:hypothetical protein
MVRFRLVVALSALAATGPIASVACTATERSTAVPQRYEQLAALAVSGTSASDRFAWSLAMSATTLVAGAPGDGGTAGRAYVFGRGPTGWHQVARLAASDGSANDYFGESLAVSGGTLVVGAPGHADVGRAYVFEQGPGGWRQLAELGSLRAPVGSGFGLSVAISGNVVAIGAPSAGRAYVFTKTVTGWRQTAELRAPRAASVPGFGASVGISGATLVVGAPSEGSSMGPGRAYVFDGTVTGWHQTAVLDGSGAPPPHWPSMLTFGSSTAISGNTLVVGAPTRQMSAVAAYVFGKTAAGWQLRTVLEGLSGLGEQIRAPVAVSGNTVVVGGTTSARVFAGTATGWDQVAQLGGPPGEFALVQYGLAVAVSGTTIAVGPMAKSSGDQLYIFGK